jgi:hypothetical protein
VDILNLLEGEGKDKDKQGLASSGLIRKCQGKENQVFFKKMRGDYYRYRCEYANKADRKKYIEKAQDAYAEAEREAMSNMKSTHPIKLGLALNFSVFYYEILSSPDIACDKAKKAFDQAIRELDEMDEGEYPDSASIMQLLRDNLTLWTTDLDEINQGAKDAEDR